MTDPDDRPSAGKSDFSERVGARAARKLKAQRQVNRTVWTGLGMMGLVGWSVAIPTLLGAALGLWIDSRYPGARSWTLALLAAGLVLGCFNAWRWIVREDREIHKNGDDGDE
ncbi:MAG: AtpZ/AtpI family protein [Propionivibrio sp.]